VTNSPVATLVVSDREVAKQIVDSLLGCSRPLNEMLQDVRGKVDEVTYNELRHSVGRIMGHEMYDLLIRMLTLHPDLDEHGILSRRDRADG
jgi:hypothetical protein